MCRPAARRASIRWSLSATRNRSGSEHFASVSRQLSLISVAIPPSLLRRRNRIHRLTAPQTPVVPHSMDLRRYSLGGRWHDVRKDIDQDQLRKTVRDKKRYLMDQTQQTSGSGIADRVRERASAQLNEQKDRATDGLGSVAQAVRQSTQQLRAERHETVAQYVEQAADQLERFSTRLKEKNISELVGDAQRLARRQPALFIGGAFAIGLLGARFLKSSSDQAAGSQRFDRGRISNRAFATRENY
jgi:ElaB/YqjD/DUF883 family membrane-anchored ribosome-binding protein